jgi:hypothetical protein
MRIKTVLLIAVLGGFAEAKQPLSPESEAKVSAYKEKLAHKSLDNLLSETGINLGVTASHCGADFAERIVKSVKESTDSDELIKNWERTDSKGQCREASAKLTLSADALKKRSKDAFRAFQKAAEGK